MAATHLRRSGSEVWACFQNNIQSMKDFKKLNAFVRETVIPAEEGIQKALERRKSGSCLSCIDGLTYAVKDNLCTKDVETTCSSDFLRGYQPPYSASVIEMLTESGAVMIGKTNMDEFGMGSSNLYSCHGPTISPWSPRREITNQNEDQEYYSDDWVVCGGSSGGSAVAVAKGMCDFALGSDTGGSVRLPASFCGVIGLKPTYSRVSRYGLIPLANSMDTIGIISSHVNTIASVLDVISGFDSKDSTTVRMDHDSCSEAVQTDNIKDLLKNIRIGIPKDISVPQLDSNYESLLLSIADRLAKEGSTITDVSLPHFKHGVASYNIISCAEVTSNMAKYSGLLFGYNSNSKAFKNFEEMFSVNRLTGLGSVVQHRIIAGMYFLSYHGRHHYDKATRVRHLIHTDFQSVFSNESPNSVDVILTPVTLGSAPTQSTVREMGPVESSIYDTYTVPVNLSGLPAISIPIGLSDNGLPLGIQIIGKWMNEKNLLKVARTIELIVK